MAQNKVLGHRNLAGVAAKRPPHMVIFRIFNRTYSVGTIVLFAEDSAVIDQQAAESLDKYILIVSGKPNKIEIRVYEPRHAVTPGGPYADGWQLARARAMAAMKYLIDHGIVAERIRVSQEGALEPDTLYSEDKKPVPSSRVEVYALDEYLETAKTNPQPTAIDETTEQGTGNSK
jgi:outer membrane protein OmpA-like peptidoglycan-associated protein